MLVLKSRHTFQVQITIELKIIKLFLLIIQIISLAMELTYKIMIVSTVQNAILHLIH